MSLQAAKEFERKGLNEKANEQYLLAIQTEPKKNKKDV